MKKIYLIVAIGFLAGCTRNLNEGLGTLKNPYGTLETPYNLKTEDNINPFVLSNYEILLEGASDKPKNGESKISAFGMSRYLTAGFALSDYYCEQFFRDADESQRRRRFGRSVTNDVGTAMSAILGLANAGENVVTGAATSFGLADNLWRNYDDAFVVSADLSTMKSLVYAAQDNFRQKTLGTEEGLPQQYGTAQSIILRYANFCSTLGMKSLLNISANQQKIELDKQTLRVEKNPTGKPELSQQPAKGAAAMAPAVAAPTLVEPAAASPSIPVEPKSGD